MDAQLHSIQVDFAGLLEVLGKNLYSTPVVAVRELVQNAHDSIIRRRLEGGDDGGDELCIRVEYTSQQLILSDDGAGLTHDEIVEYLATIGRGYTRELRREHESADLIGAFGLGFLTAYVVSDHVEVITRSHKEPEQTWRFSSRGGQQFTLSEHAQRARIGTTIVLDLGEGFEQLCDPEHLSAILSKYCSLLTVPIYLGSAQAAVNAERPPWERDEAFSRSVEGQRKRLEFAGLFERYFEPLATIMIPPTPDGEVVGGMIWIQSGASYATSDQRNVSVFVRRMLVSSDARELLPAWAGFCGAVIASNDLVPTASREDLMKDAVYERVQRHVQESLITGLQELARYNQPAWRRILRRHNWALLGAALGDDRLFELLEGVVTVPTTEGDMTLPRVLERERRLYVSTYEGRAIEEVLFRALQRPIVNGNLFAVYPFVKKYADHANVPMVELGTKRGQDTMFAPSKLAPDVEARARALFERPKFALSFSSYAPATLPAVLVYDHEVELKKKLEADEADKRITHAILGLARLYTEQIDDTVDATFYLNVGSELVQQLIDPSSELDDAKIRASAALIWNITLMMAPLVDSSVDMEATLEDLNTQLALLLGA